VFVRRLDSNTVLQALREFYPHSDSATSVVEADMLACNFQLCVAQQQALATDCEVEAARAQKHLCAAQGRADAAAATVSQVRHRCEVDSMPTTLQQRATYSFGQSTLHSLRSSEYVVCLRPFSHL
jgi:hypothetical protein